MYIQVSKVIYHSALHCIYTGQTLGDIVFILNHSG